MNSSKQLLKERPTPADQQIPNHAAAPGMLFTFYSVGCLMALPCALPLLLLCVCRLPAQLLDQAAQP
jgi:hypothetical protein